MTISSNPLPTRSLPTIALLLLVVSSVLAGEITVPVYVDGKLATWQEKAVVRNGKTYAPLRAAAEAIGAHVTWNSQSKIAVVCRGDRCVPIRQDQGIIISGRLYIPLRLMAEALQCQVTWDAKRKAVLIETSPQLPESG